MIVMKRNVLFFECALFWMCSKWNVPLNVLFFGMWSIGIWSKWNVLKTECDQKRICSFGIKSKWKGLFLECDQNGMGSKRNVAYLECEQNEMWTKWNVLKKECDHLWSNVRFSERVIKINIISNFTQVSISSPNVDL